jgi:hypothetical protein
MGIYKREGSDVWYLRYWDANGKLVRRTSGTKNEAEAQAVLAEAQAEVALQKRAKFDHAVSGLGREEPADLPLPERVRRLEHIVRGLVRLHVTEFEMLRQWATTEVGDPDRD